MAQLVAEATGARRADVWLRVGSELRPEASWPGGADAPAPRPLSRRRRSSRSRTSTPPRCDTRATCSARSRSSRRPTTRWTRPRRRWSATSPRRPGLVLRNVGLIEDLRASRQRLVAAQDEERRKLERNIHDGVQQQLVALSVQLRLAEQLTERDPAKAREMLAHAAGPVERGARGPARPGARHLPAAARRQGTAGGARGASPEVPGAGHGRGRRRRSVPAGGRVGRLLLVPGGVEQRREVRRRVDRSRSRSRNATDLWSSASSTTAEGSTPPQIGHGTGLQGVADRLDAIGGSLRVESSVGAGTTLTGSIPSEPTA